MRDCSRSYFADMLRSSQSNILVNTAGHARITNFGLAVVVAPDPYSIRNSSGTVTVTVTDDLDSIRNASDEHRDSARWIAPEILDGRGTYSKEADVFSFAMVTVEVRCGYLTQGRHLANLCSPYQRHSLVLSRLVTNHFARLFWQSSAVSVRHGRPIRL